MILIINDSDESVRSNVIDPNIWWGDETPYLVVNSLYKLIARIMICEHMRDDEIERGQKFLIDSVVDAYTALTALRNHYDISWNDVVDNIESKNERSTLHDNANN